MVLKKIMKLHSLNFILLFFLLSLSKNIQPQDLIVTQKGDSLNCKIRKVKSDFLYITYRNKNQLLNTTFFRDEVKSYKKKFFSYADIDSVKNSDEDAFPSIRTGIYGGYSYLIGEIYNKLDPYQRQIVGALKSGYHAGADIHYFELHYIGLGINYSFFISNYKDKYVQSSIRIHYIGPSIAIKPIAFKKVCLFTNFSLGYFFYNLKLSVLYSNTELKSGTFGINSDIAIDFSITKNLILSPGFSLKIGALSYFDKYTNGKRETIQLNGVRENISRMDVSLGLRWSK